MYEQVESCPAILEADLEGFVTEEVDLTELIFHELQAVRLVPALRQ